MSRPLPRTHQPAAADTEPHLRLGFLTHLDHTDDLDVVYAENLELISTLEQLDYDSAWVATRHFHAGWANLPSPFAFLGAAAALTARITLGTAVVPIIVDDPVRLAEEVSVLDHLARGRIQLGLGKGVPSSGYHVFARWGHERDNDYLSKVEQLHWALQGSQVPDSDATIHPPNEDLRGRIYHGTSTWSTIRRAAQLGDGFVLERFGHGDERTPENRRLFLGRQADSILEYRSEFERTWGSSRTPHVVLSRSSWPAESTELALAEVTAATREWNAFSRRVGRLPEGLSAADELTADNVVWGNVDDIVADLVADPSFGLSDELVLGLHPGRFTLAEAIDKALILRNEVYPLLDEEWRKARAGLSSRVAEYDAQRATVTA
jgi:alkanesulfonate monooxygenase SsuD/methylene tetrahydromethanopterin reductase-like flavin-dependent oxidoreductase (luciferase family)